MSSRPHPESGRPMHGPLQSFDLDAEVARLRKGEGMSVVLLVMGAGERLAEHAAPGPISVAVREGRVRFATSDGEVEAGPETLLALDGGVRHAVEALEDAVCVITIARGGRS